MDSSKHKHGHSHSKERKHSGPSCPSTDDVIIVTGPIGPTGPVGPQGIQGPTGPTGQAAPIPTLPYLDALAAVNTVPNVFTTITYYSSTGPLSGQLNSGTGIFTVPEPGLYQVSAWVTFQLESDPNTRNDGDRLCRIVRKFASGQNEPTFIGSYAFVPPSLAVRGGYTPFYTPLTTGGTLLLSTGDQLYFEVYQNNIQNDGIEAYCELQITKISEISSTGLGTILNVTNNSNNSHTPIVFQGPKCA